MNREAGGATTLLVGALLVRLAATGVHRRYVRPSMGPWLLLAGVVLLVLGATALVVSLRKGRAPGDDHHDGHDHASHGVERVGWVLLAPVVTVLLVAPPALGSYGVDRTALVDVQAGGATFEPLAPSDVARPMTLLEFRQRAVDQDGASFAGATVELTGFVVADSDSSPAGGFRIARFQIACCAADAAASVIRVTGTSGSPPASDRWVTVTGTYDGASDADANEPRLRATSVVEIRPPDDPYE